MQLAHQSALRVGGLEVRPATREVVWPAGREVLQPRVMQVLVALAGAGGEVVSRDDLIASCWAGRVVSEDAINFVIGQVRKLAARTGAFRLETIARVGYRLVAEPVADAAPQPAATEPPPAPAASRPDRRALLKVSATGLAVTAAAGGGYAAWRALRPRPATAATVAVLPFDDLTPTPGSRYLALGLAREVRNSLSRVAGLSVIADASSFGLARGGLTDQALGARLGADLLLKGSVAQMAGDVRISTELIDIARGLQVWAETHESRGGDLFQLQDQVAGAVIQELIARVGAGRIRQPPAPRPRDPEVFRIMLGAGQLLEQTRALRMVNREAEALDAADQVQALVDRAAAVDPRDAGVLVAEATLVRNGWTRALASQPLSGAQRADAAAELLRNALVTDPNDPSALAALGDYYRRFEWRWDEAETLFQSALAIDPNHLEAHWAYGYQLGTLGRALEGLTHARAVLRLDPETVWRRLALPRILYTVGADAECKARYDTELAANPDNLFLIRELYFRGLTESDPAALRRLVVRVRDDLWRGRPPLPVQALLARIGAGVEALEGRPAALIALVDADVAAYDDRAGTKQGRASVDFLFIYAMEYGWAGAIGPAITMLDRALAARSLYWPSCLPFGRQHFPAAVRGDPRYAALWRTDPKRAELVARRLDAAQRRQMLGYLPDGRRVAPSAAAIREA
jgi:TolB-like protein/DNA-binding winged helix-turn-helix (wHTH) protein